MDTRPSKDSSSAPDQSSLEPALVNPTLVNVWRGDRIESIHRGAVCIVGASGRVLFEIGDTKSAIYPRSAIKLIQALSLIETGAADAFNFTDEELALACASHNGEARHAELALAVLLRLGLSTSALACGEQPPMGDTARTDLAWSHNKPSQLHNNCSGKHAGMLATALHMGEPCAGYELADHPVQLRVRETLAQLTDTNLDDTAPAIDGCSVPTWPVPLESLARAFHRLVSPGNENSIRGQAASRLIAACTANPELTSGSNRRCTQVMEATAGRAYIKVGAEGVYCGAIPSRQLGFALKIADGAFRAAEVTAAEVVATCLPACADALQPYREVELTNWRGTSVGQASASPHFKQALSAL